MTWAISIAFALSGLVVVGIALLKVFRSLDPSRISGYLPCKGGWWEAELNQCSAGLLRIPQQPVNTYTNVAYVFGGFFLLFRLNTLPSYILSLTLLYLCVGSALYHATSTRWAGSLDVSAMYAVFSAMTTYVVCRFFSFDNSLVAFLMFIVAVLCGYLLRYKYRGNMSLKIGIFLVLIYIFTIWSIVRNNRSLVSDYLIVSLAMFVLAYLAWFLDRAKNFPLKRWGHGLWHVLTAAAISILFYGSYLAE